MKREHNFGEKEYEGDKPVWQTPKFLSSREKAIEMIESEKYGLEDADFWILKNTYDKGTKVMYSGLIISHNGCLKINDSIENKFNPKCYRLEQSSYTNGLIGIYEDDELIEYGEVSTANCKNAYPYAMLLKRTFDRVVLKKSKLAYSNVYSEAEADEFREDEPREALITKTQIALLLSVYKGENLNKLLAANKINKIEEMTANKASEIIKKIKEKQDENNK